MTAAQKKTRRGGAGWVWKQLAIEFARALSLGLPWLATGIAWGLSIALEVRP